MSGGVACLIRANRGQINASTGGKTAAKLKQQLLQMYRSDCMAVGDVASTAA